MTKEEFYTKWQPNGFYAHNPVEFMTDLESVIKTEQSLQAAVMQSPPLDGLPDNKPIYKDSGLWQMRSDNMEDVIIQQRVNESDDAFLKRCRDFHAEEMNQLLSNDGGGAA